MKKLLSILSLSLSLVLSSIAQTPILSTGFEGPGFDEGWTTGVSQAITLSPEDYPAGIEAWEEWALTDMQGGFGFVHSGDSAAWIGGTLNLEPTHDWLMTPVFDVPENGITQIKYWLWYHSEASYINKFYIMIYDYDKENWEQGYLLANAFNSPLHYLEEYSFDLDPWKGKKVKVAFVKNGTYQMAMDDIKVVNYQGVQDIDHINIKLYPNPVVNQMVLENISTVKTIHILDVYGRQVIMKKNAGSHTLNIDLSNLEKGNYVVSLYCNGHKTINKLIYKK